MVVTRIWLFEAEMVDWRRIELMTTELLRLFQQPTIKLQVVAIEQLTELWMSSPMEWNETVKSRERKCDHCLSLKKEHTIY